MASKRFFLLLAAAIVATLLFAFGCSDDDVTDPEVDPEAAQQAADEAGDSLADIMTRMIDSTLVDVDSTFRPRDLDFSRVHRMYSNALSLDPSCRDAKFGAAFTGLFLVLGDEDLNTLIDEIKDLYDTLDANPFRVMGMVPMPDVGGQPLVDGMPMHIGKFAELIPSPMALDQGMMKLAVVDSAVSELQRILEVSLLPHIQEARTHLGDLVNAPDYTFTITPEMQGNDGASPILLDRSDFQLFLSAANAVEAGLHIFFSRYLDLPSYDAAGVQEAMTKGTDFLSLKSGGVGAGHMSSAKARLLDCITGIKQTTSYLRAEIGTDQSYDLIKVTSSDINDLDDVDDVVDSILWYFSGVRQIELTWTAYWDCYWNGQYYQCDPVKDTISTSVDLAKFFDDPINNYKDFIPNYTVTLEQAGDLYVDYAADHFNRDRYWYVLDSLFGLTYPNDTPYFNYHLPDENTAEFYGLIGSEQQFVWGWDDVNNYCGPGATDQYCYYSRNRWSYYDYYYYTSNYIACYDWEAATFEEWTFPNATMNGLFPSMTSNDWKDIWATDLEIEWYPSDCDTLYLGF